MNSPSILHPSPLYSSLSSPYLVRPAKLPNLHITDGRVFKWNYPDSWERPCTFFGLHFQVKVVHNGQSCNSEDYITVTTTRSELILAFVKIYSQNSILITFLYLLYITSLLVQDSITEDTKYEVTVKTKKYVFCVRAQDKFTTGPWSPWSQCM